MDKERLTKYLEQLKDLEWILYTQNQLLAKIKSQSAQLCVSYKRTPPTAREFHYLYAFDLHRLGQRCFLGAAIWAVSIFLICLDPFEWNILKDGAYDANFKFLMFSPLVIIVYVVFATAIRMYIEKSEYRQSQKRVVDDFIKQKAADQKRIEQERPVKQELTRQIAQLEASRNETRKALEKLYSLNVIYPKYRSLVPIISFYEYFASGICNCLTGYEGAYARYEQDERFGRLETKLDTIITHLEDIKRNQDLLFQSLNETNRILSRVESSNNKMIHSLDAIEKNSALAEYNTRAAAANTRALGEFVVFKELLS